ncbi:MAG: hypothetical protein JXM69_11030 [Anaerolineae bacterium]|nr:hypothetical protein [Anaerolineae bacterium]
MESKTRLKKGLFIGALIGAVLGTGVAYLLLTTPSDEKTDEPITGKELLSLTSMAALLVRRIDSLRRKL